jgi:hypothetical protein
MSSDPQREQTYGEKAVGLTFNPSQHPLVADLKTKYAEIIDMLNNQLEPNLDGESVRLIKIAITEAQTAQMWAVKAATWNLK